MVHAAGASGVFERSGSKKVETDYEQVKALYAKTGELAVATSVQPEAGRQTSCAMPSDDAPPVCGVIVAGRRERRANEPRSVRKKLVI